MTSNNFKSLKSMMKDTYSKRNKGPKAHSEEEASKNPMKFMKENKNFSLKGKKGIAV